MHAMLRAFVVMLAMSFLPLTTGSARAEIGEVRLAQQYGAVYLPLMVMENNKLVEKHLAAQGLPDTKVSWIKFAGPANIVDAFLSGNVDFGAQGVPSLALLWDRTKGGLGIKAAYAVTANDIWLNTRAPHIKSLKDFTDTDRIAIPSAKTSSQAISLQIAAEKTFGPGQHAKLDPLTVSMSHPDALAAVLNPSHEVTTHFATSPFHENEIKSGLRTITSVREIFGGLLTGVSFTTSTKFREANPKAYAASVAALGEALDWINADYRRAAKLFIEMTKEKRLSEDEVTAMLGSKDVEYGKIPRKAGVVATHMHKVGTLKNKPESWKDLYFPEAHGLAGD